MGIWRKVEAFVRPFSNENKYEVHLLLGLPWLHAVGAKIKIEDSIIRIGDSEKGESAVDIRGPKFVESEEHKLVLCQSTKGVENKIQDMESSSEDSDYSASEEDESDDEGFIDIFEEGNTERQT